LNNYIKLLRPHQWAKQSIVFIPVLSLGNSFTLESFLNGIAAVVSFTLIASSVYVVNDLFDLEEDRADIIRKHRPLAAGSIAQDHAKYFLIVLLGTGFFINVLLSKSAFLTNSILLFYVILNITYSKLYLKKRGVLGISIVAIGFPLRFAFGCLFTEIPISYWALLLLMELSLFMLSVKRFQRSIRKGASTANDTTYEPWLISAMVFAAFFSASYVGFISTPATQRIWGLESLLLSAVPMAIGIVRFLEIAIQPKNLNSSDVTDSVFKDLPLVILVILYSCVMFIGSLTHAQ
jgi:decaprenyl-phosphate phosphoribosyltransferase